jgi:putative spermidine/putrescine transport system permease protein
MGAEKPLLLHIVVWAAALAVALPLVLLVIWSFANRWPMPQLVPATFSLRGWQRLFSGYINVWQVTVSSIGLSLFAGTLSTLIAAMTSRALCLYSFPGKRLIEGFAMLPIIVPATVFGMGSHILFIRLGLGSTLTAVVVCHLINTLPFALRVMLETTRMASFRFEEQARVLGASPFRSFWHGTLPAIAPGLVSALAVSFLFSYTQYFLTLLMGGGKVKTLSIIVMPLIEGSDRTISSVYSLLFIASAAGVFAVLQGVSAIVAQYTGKQLGVAP